LRDLLFVGGHCFTDIDISIEPAIAINMVDTKDQELNLPYGITIVNPIHDPKVGPKYLK
tara:strand:- start:5 stop:181 length:177 start_codon:yes stop_codon:yes gene_type:complete